MDSWMVDREDVLISKKHSNDSIRKANRILKLLLQVKADPAVVELVRQSIKDGTIFDDFHLYNQERLSDVTVVFDHYKEQLEKENHDREPKTR